VIVPIEDVERLLEQLEDSRFQAAHALADGERHPVPWEQVKSALGSRLLAGSSERIWWLRVGERRVPARSAMRAPC
jgi:hypothetical protein